MADTAVVEGSVGAQSEWAAMSDEQREADVDAAIASVQAKRAPAESSVGEKTPPAEPEQDMDETPGSDDETPVVADAAKVETTEDEGEPESDEDDAAWLDDDTREYATTMGLTDDDLAEFGSREELDRALRIIDRKAFEAAKAPPAEKVVEKPPVRQPEQQSPSQQDGDSLTELAQFKLDDELGSDDAPKIVKAISAAATAIKLRDEKIERLESRLAAIEERNQESAFASLRSKVLESLHSLGNTELFGKPGEQPTAEQVANIEKAIEAHFIHARGLLAMKRNVAPTPAFLKAAVNQVFGDRLTQIEKRRLADRLRKQSARRTGGHSVKALPPDTSKMSDAGRLKADPDIDAKFRSLISERHG